jgi:hypothetical protein
MTQEVLKLKFEQGKLTQAELYEFFESHVCTPKGENRHPYADVLHAQAEGTKIGWSRYYGVWADTDDAVQLRIKPAEPIYEYKWSVGVLFDIPVSTNEFYTEEEMKQFGDHFIKIKETKRERK